MATSSGKYLFKKHDSIGANDAEDDTDFLTDCFVDVGDIDVLCDCRNPKRIVLGRTGSGKTALLHEMRNRIAFVISLNPEDLSFNYLTNSTILKYLNSLDINLDPFYKLLWRHVFAVSIIQDRFDVVDEQRQRTLLTEIIGYFTSRETKAHKKRELEKREKALKYLEKWGDRFFEGVEQRTQQITKRFEQEVSAGLSAQTKVGAAVNAPIASIASQLAVNASLDGSQRVEVENQQELFQRAQDVINSIQVRELSGIIELIDGLLDDPQKPCFIVIDRLDEQWVDETIRHRLLKGLVDTVKEFGKVSNAKIVICLRVDLLEQLFRATRSEAGFQEDKYSSLYLHMNWAKDQLQAIADKRVARLIRDAYTGYEPGLLDIVPDSIRFGRKRRFQTVEFILARTWKRPRDVIEFLNACIRRAEGKASITKEMLLDAEGEYSRGRLRAIAQEWHASYPCLVGCVKSLLVRRLQSFRLGEFADSQLDDWAMSLACSETPTKGRLFELATQRVNGDLAHSLLRSSIASILFKVGCVGLKTATFQEARWSNSESYSVSPAELDDDTLVYIHPGLWRVLGVNAESN